MSCFLKYALFRLRAHVARKSYRAHTVHFTALFASFCVAAADPLAAQSDFGDAPAPYPTLLSADGARHSVVQGMFLGAGVTADPDGQPDPNANADARDDGVTFLGSITAGNNNVVRVVASVPGKLDAWI